ncbi:hypothetical protein PC120_g20825 [Phytophthora cactorum]|nr:hypothetical protein PC120_g20825 [Phytophthora cactorum]
MIKGATEALQTALEGAMVVWMEKVTSVAKKTVNKSDARRPQLEREENKPDAVKTDCRVEK